MGPRPARLLLLYRRVHGSEGLDKGGGSFQILLQVGVCGGVKRGGGVFHPKNFDFVLKEKEKCLMLGESIFP